MRTRHRLPGCRSLTPTLGRTATVRRLIFREGTTVTESATSLVIEQSGLSVRLEKPLTKNSYYTLVATYGEDLFLPLITRNTTYVLYARGAHMFPYQLTCFDTRSGA